MASVTVSVSSNQRVCRSICRRDEESRRAKCTGQGEKKEKEKGRRK